MSATDAIPCTDLRSVPREARLALLRLILMQRLFEERAMALYRQGRIAGSFYDGRGQEAVAAAAGFALATDDVVCPLNRELATHFAKGVTVTEAFRNFLGKGDSPTRGRDGNMHFGVPHRGVFPLVSMLGNLVPVTVGAALAFKRRGEHRVAMTFLGEGAFSVGDTHEGLNLAGVWQVPAVFVLQRNQYAYSTPTRREMVNPRMAERAYGGWSIPCETVDGTDAIETFDAIASAVGRARAGLGPQAVEAVTLRIHGHAAHDDGSYVPEEIRAAYAPRDPVERLLVRLALDGVGGDDLAELRNSIAAEIEAGLAEAERSPAPDPASVTEGVWARPLGRHAVTPAR
jgi:TPP-dependent pyruvate/acetoin dehydrogenase alpha subunit